jgi:asparagine synthase (glutamine-hydrolysing)
MKGVCTSKQGVGLGHRRLSIIDLSTGQQPLYNEDQTVCVVFNGEIYNYQELIPELLALGHIFHTRSDTEVIVHAWEAWGEDCVRRFRGMFAFALWDRARETLFLARDRLAVKPLYYALLPDGHLSSLAPNSSPCWPMVAWRATLTRWRSRSTSLSVTWPSRERSFGQARKLPPAHTLTLRRGLAGWRAPRSIGTCASASTIPVHLAGRSCAQLNDKLSESIRLRMIAEVPLGAFLSGGVDSSAVVALMAGLSADPVNTCSIAFDDPAFNEAARLPRRLPTAIVPTIIVTWLPVTIST